MFLIPPICLRSNRNAGLIFNCREIPRFALMSFSICLFLSFSLCNVVYIFIELEGRLVPRIRRRGCSKWKVFKNEAAFESGPYKNGVFIFLQFCWDTFLMALRGNYLLCKLAPFKASHFSSGSVLLLTGETRRKFPTGKG